MNIIKFFLCIRMLQSPQMLFSFLNASYRSPPFSSQEGMELTRWEEVEIGDWKARS